jgi:acyl-coenzyme A synthetase/AMP-(fatty) acid ligase
MNFSFIRKIILFSIWFDLGEAMKPQEWAKFINLLSSSNARIFVQYGMSECNGVLGCHPLNINDAVMPLGYPFPGVRCLLINEQGQVINPLDSSSDIGQIHIGG